MPKEYMYAVDRNNDYLAHYGIKGMKWGAHKALDEFDRRAYRKHYRKATRKLKRLENHANARYNDPKNIVVDASKLAATSGLVAGGIADPRTLVYKAGMAGYNAIKAGTSKNAAEKAEAWRKEMLDAFDPGHVFLQKYRKDKKRAR